MIMRMRIMTSVMRLALLEGFLIGQVPIRFIHVIEEWSVRYYHLPFIHVYFVRR